MESNKSIESKPEPNKDENLLSLRDIKKKKQASEESHNSVNESSRALINEKEKEKESRPKLSEFLSARAVKFADKDSSLDKKPLKIGNNSKDQIDKSKIRIQDHDPKLANKAHQHQVQEKVSMTSKNKIEQEKENKLNNHSKNKKSFEEDISVTSNDDLLSLTGHYEIKNVKVKESPVKTPNIEKSDNQAKGSLIANKAGFKLASKSPDNYLNVKTAKANLLENEGGNILLSPNKDSKTSQGKLSVTKEEQEIDYNLTSSSIAKLVKRSVTKETPKSLERKPSGDTEDIFLSDPEEKTDKTSFIYKQGAIPKASLEKKRNDYFEEENKIKTSEIISSKTKGKNTVKPDSEKDVDNWFGFVDSNKANNSQRKPGGPQLMPSNDIFIDLDDDEDDDIESSKIMTLASKFKKQKISQSIASDEFDMKPESNIFSEFRDFRKDTKENSKQKAVLANEPEAIELIDSLPTSPIQMPKANKNNTKGND